MEKTQVYLRKEEIEALRKVAARSRRSGARAQQYWSASYAICRHRGIISGAAIGTGYPQSMPAVSRS
jgi:hypothetical protein